MTVAGAGELAPVSLRVTTVFRRERDGWRIVHRHADPITEQRAPESVVQRPVQVSGPLNQAPALERR